MEVKTEYRKSLFQLVSTSKNSVSFIISKKRSILGRLDNADVVIDHEAVSSVHAVIELIPGGAIIFDLNSTNGTWVNGKQIVTERIKLGDRVQFANQEFILKEYAAVEAAPAVLEMLNPQTGSASVIGENRKLPGALDIDVVMPAVVYPLATDPKAMFSEYIFEDAESIQPIFHYQVGKTAVEVIILYDDIVYSVDYLPNKDGIYQLTGFMPDKNKEVEFPYLGKNNRSPLIEIRGGEIFAFKLTDFRVMYLSDIKSVSDSNFKLSAQDIIRFDKGGLQIFIRNVDTPPRVLTPPFFKIDRVFSTIIFFTLLSLIGFIAFIHNFPINQKIEQERSLENLARILDTTKAINFFSKRP